MELTDKQKARLFDALEADGVDNWEGYNFDGGSYEQEINNIEVENKFEENKKTLEPLFDIISEYCEVDYPAGKEAGAGVNITEEGVKQIVKFITYNYEKKESNNN